MSLSLQRSRLNRRYYFNVRFLPTDVVKNSTTLLVLERLCELADADGQVFPSNERLATESHCSIRTIREIRRYLESIGLLVTVTERAGRTTVQRLALTRIDALLVGHLPTRSLLMFALQTPANPAGVTQANPAGVNEQRKAIKTPANPAGVTRANTAGANEQRKRKSDTQAPPVENSPTPANPAGTPADSAAVQSTHRDQDQDPSTPEGGTGVRTGVGMLADPKSEGQDPGLRPSALLTDKNRRLLRKFAFEGLDTGLWGNPVGDGPDGLRVSEMVDDLKRFVARTLGLSGRDVSETLVGLATEIEAAWKRKRGIARAPDPWAGDRRIAR